MKKGILLLGISLSFAFAVECKDYRVKKGDTLSSIARREGVDLESIKRANEGLDERRLTVGQKICIPIKTTQKGAIDKYAIYEVKRGDTLQKIADSFGVDVDTLKEFNNLKDDKIVEGQKIKIPARAKKEDYDLYLVKRGGRLEHVAKATGVPLKELERLNPELKNKWLKAGTKVKVPKGTMQAKGGKGTKEESYTFYTIKRGGKLEHVARATGASLKEVERLNPELKGRWLSPGTRVKIPIKEVEKTKEEGRYEFYTVRRGGRLEHVAKATGVPLKELERLNPELKNKWLKAGTKVRIPRQEVASKPVLKEEVGRKEERSLVKDLEKENNKTNAQPLRNLNIQPPVEGKISKVPKGIEIHALCSAPVKAVEDGRVIYSGGDLQAYGNMVIIEHENFISLYAYNETNLVKRGERVSKGQTIARVGKKNNSDECMLRFEIRNKEGVPLDPTEYIKDIQ